MVAPEIRLVSCVVRPVFGDIGQLHRHDHRDPHATADDISSETSVRTTAFSESFDEYGIKDGTPAIQVSVPQAIASIMMCGSRWPRIARLDRPSDAVLHRVGERGRAVPWRAKYGCADSVTGVRFDTDPQGRQQAVFRSEFRRR